MTTYNFKRNTEFYIVYGGLKYKLDVYKGVTFSQTFSEESVVKKTLHNPNNNFDGVSIVKAAPANFNFTIPLLNEDDLKIVFNLLIDYDGYNIKSFDLYADSDHGVYKIQTAVIESGAFRISTKEPLSLEISGSGSKLSRVGDSSSYTIPGTLQTRSSTTTYVIPRILKCTVSGSTLDYVTGVTLELQNKIAWTENKTLQASLAVTDETNTIYPSSYTLEGRILSGSLTQYVTSDSYVDGQTWDTDAPITIQTGAGPSYTLEISIPSAVYTNRITPDELYTQTFDFRMLTNPSALSSVITYN